MRILQLSQVSKRYGGRREGAAPLDRVTVGFDAGTFTAIVGPSGSGKSTLLHCAAGLDQPTSGEVELEGVRLDALDERRLTVLRRRRIGFVFQSYNLIPTLTVGQNVELPLMLDGKRAGRSEIDRVLDVVGMQGHRNSRPHQLSGGQRQRTAIARALVSRPAAIFADEPTGALDIASARDVLDLLRATIDETGTTAIVVTHDPVVAARADRVIFLADGRVVRELHHPTAETVSAGMTEISRHPQYEARSGECVSIDSRVAS